MSDTIKNPKHITATFEIVTPMFLGGADHQASRIRETSIKGALAFWWRALNYGRFINAAGEKPKKALEAMQKEEQALFGGGDCGQGAFLLKISKQPEDEPIGAKAVLTKPGTKYLGYGLMEADSERFCIKNGTFELKIIYKDKDLALVTEQLLPALKIFGLLGGLGSRVRRGWGSVALQSLEGNGIEWTPPANAGVYKTAIKDIVGTPTPKGAKWPVTAFAEETDIRLGTLTNENSLIVLDAIGIGLQRYRGYRGVGEQNFQADHDWFKEESHRSTTGKFCDSKSVITQVDGLPKRTAFGLPHNYFSYKGASDGKNLNMGVSGPNDKMSRRASPLMIHVHEFQNGIFFGVIAFFPVQFLGTRKISVNNSKKDFEFDQDVISYYLNGLKPNGDQPNKGDYFPSTKVL